MDCPDILTKMARMPSVQCWALSAMESKIQVNLTRIGPETFRKQGENILPSYRYGLYTHTSVSGFSICEKHYGSGGDAKVFLYK